ncbi:uncharacterized protein [Chironomus tepperi]|uniref:uncharacterized protein n=1 Tax=Chironomus tepperi TaxID=113505 RepID=UPI00391F6830
MTSKYSTFLLFFIHFVAAPLPSIFPVCFRNDPQLSNCIVQAVNALKPRLASGDLGDGFKTIRLDPLYIPKITYGSTSRLRTKLTNVYLKGVSNFNIEKLHANINDLKFDMILTFPKIDIKADYQMIFGYLGAPMFSEGQSYERLENSKVRVTMHGRLIDKNGQKFIKFDPFYFKIIENKINFIDFTNFFPSTTFLGPLIKNYFVNNADFLNAKVYPDFEKAFSDTFTYVANQIALGATFDEAFPF